MSSLDKNTAKVGARVQNHWGELGTIVWIGEIKGGPSGVYCGVEYDLARNIATRSDGVFEGTDYFEVMKPKTGEFIRPKFLMNEIWPELAAKLQGTFPRMSEEKLMKFLLARKCNENQAVTMIKKHLAWVETAKPNPDERIPGQISEGYPLGWHGEDLEGNLLVIERPGNGGAISPKLLVKTYGVEALTRWHIIVMENVQRELDRQGRLRATFLIDLSALGEVSSKVLSWARAISAIDQDNYPETVRRIIIVNAPGFFSSVWTAVKLFIDERTREKVFLFGTTGYSETLAQYIDQKYLPPFAGGTCDGFMARGGIVGTPDDSSPTGDRDTSGDNMVAEETMGPTTDSKLESVVPKAESMNDSE